ncbi:MAG: hypothetical protein Ct9H300mP7_2760 [Verrucomicrobiota bacterium]|nr:MAG: hypothetical protein Ct9H300mP7_2760 [Verrucomicrobiota bacterium]
MMAITTSNSMSVKPDRFCRIFCIGMNSGRLFRLAKWRKSFGYFSMMRLSLSFPSVS